MNNKKKTAKKEATKISPTILLQGISLWRRPICLFLYYNWHVFCSRYMSISANFRLHTPSNFFVCFPQTGWSEQNSIINWIWETDSHLLQFEIKQLLVSLSATWPQTSSSPLSGRGFKHVLYLVWFPWWHVWEHSVQVVHSVQSPLTNDKRSHCS